MITENRTEGIPTQTARRGKSVYYTLDGKHILMSFDTKKESKIFYKQVKENIVTSTTMMHIYRQGPAMEFTN